MWIVACTRRSPSELGNNTRIAKRDKERMIKKEPSHKNLLSEAADNLSHESFLSPRRSSEVMKVVVC